MRRVHWLVLGGVLAVTSIVVIFAGSAYLRIEPLPTKEEMLRAEQLRHAERLRDMPSLKNLPPIEPMTIEQALILEHIGGFVPGYQESIEAVASAGRSPFPVKTVMLFRVEYVTEKVDNPPGTEETPVFVDVRQFPNEAWPRYCAKWSPSPDTLQQGNPDLDITRVTKFKNRVVMNRQDRSADETGILQFYWPSGKNLVTITHRTKVIDEEFLRRYLAKYPSSL